MAAEHPAATTAPQATKMPPLFRALLRKALDERMQPRFDELCAWEDDIVEALNIASEAADRMAAALEAIEETPYGDFETKGDYAAFVRDLAHNGRWPHLVRLEREAAMSLFGALTAASDFYDVKIEKSQWKTWLGDPDAERGDQDGD